MRIWCQWDAFGPLGGLGCCPFWGGGSVVVDFLFIVTPIVGVCNCSVFVVRYFMSVLVFAIILMGKRELVALLNLSSWCLVMVELLFLKVPWGCLRFVIFFVPRLFEEKRRDIVFGIPSFRPSVLPSVLPSFRPPNIVGTLCAQLLLQFYADSFETLQMF